MMWEPMITAPKDGTPVDLWCTPKGLSTGSYGRTPDCWFSEGKWWKYDEVWGDDGNRREVHNATHWMLRPQPPRTV